MKAIVMDLDHDTAAVMTEDGRFIQIPNHHYEIGQSVTLHSTAKRRRAALLRQRILAVAASAAAVLAIVCGGLAAYTVPYSLVSLDVNPSIEYTLNCFDRVLSAKGINDDGVALLTMIDEKELLHLPISLAVTVTIEQLRDAEYLSVGTENYVVLAASAANEGRAETLAGTLQKDLSLQADLTVESTVVTTEQADAAHERGTSPGKLYVVEQLSALMVDEDDFESSEWLDRPVGDIMDEIKRKGGVVSGPQPILPDDPALVESTVFPVPTPLPTPEPIVSPDLSESPTPDVEQPAVTPSPSVTPSPTSSAATSPTGSPSFSPTPTATATPSARPSSSASITVSPKVQVAE